MNLYREPPPWLRPLLGLGESLYGAAIALRRAAYGAGLIETKRAPRPVISVGNLAVGGIGKTPFVILLAQRLMKRNVQVAVLTRGYGREDEEQLVVVGDRSAAVAGDEPKLIRARTGAVVIACADRLRAAHLAVRSYGAQVLLLDDGFQHWRIHRDLDVVLLDRANPLANGRLLPRGPLREPADALSRADLLALVGEEGVKPLLPDRPTIEVAVFPSEITVGGRALPPRSISGKRVALISGIARPERFRKTVEDLGAIVTYEDRRPDHAELDLGAFFRAAAGAELFLTTEKDAARLDIVPDHLAVLAVEHRVITGSDLLDAALDRVIS